MDKFFRQLNEKGPGGIPKWIYAAGAVILLYLAYRWYSNRSTSSSATTTDTTTDPSLAQPDNGTTDSSDPSVDTLIPATDTSPPADDSTGMINGPDSIVGPGSLISKLGKKVPKKNAHKSLLDHKQGTSGTKKRAVHRRKAGTAQTAHAHAPKKKAKPHSKEKAKVTRNISAGGGRVPTPSAVHSSSTPIAKAASTIKQNPAPIAPHPAEKKIAAKAPPRKR